ncbi:MAG TPA: rhodanese-like domain-containing protein [Ktedonobacterales bacterium]
MSIHDARQTPEVSAREALEKLEAGDGALLVDVRERWEYDEAHAPGATLIPLSEFTKRFTELPSDQELLIICHSGYRSLQATNFLQRQGYALAANVMGGMEEWEAAGLPVERGAQRS